MAALSATYSPDDNKLRLYASSRLDADTYARVKAAGFKWAPKQDLFVAPMWTPHREDLLIDLCGEIGDEDTSLIDRAEDRAERFDEYSDKRRNDAERARKAVAEIADNIPMGQPILVGHHSERHARRDAQRIENGMRKAVDMWETSQYWTARAAGAIRHAKYKELPAVRARRIKGLEADKRKAERSKSEAATWLKVWTACGAEADSEKQHKIALYLANRSHMTLPRKEGDRPGWEYSPSPYDVLREDRNDSLYAARTVAEIVEHAQKVYPANMAHNDRWIAHYENRLSYERAMLNEQGASDLLKPAPRRALAPLLNYRAPGGSITAPHMYDRNKSVTYRQVDMTKAEYAAINVDYKGARVSADKTHRFRTAMVRHELVCVFLTDSKAVAEPEAQQAKPEAPREFVAPLAPREKRSKPEATAFDAMRAQLKHGVQVVTVPQLFSTPADLGARMVDMAEIQDGDEVLEPNAGTGALVDAVRSNIAAGRSGRCVITAVEINLHLAERLRDLDCLGQRYVRCVDFLQCKDGELGKFDKILMNPPFENAADIKHIEHAATMLKPGGRLVAICANGPRQNAKLRPLADEWEVLPPGTFAGTNASAALLVINAPDQP